MAEFYNDQLRLVTVNISGDSSVWNENSYLEISDQEKYPDVDMLQVLSKVADQIEASSMPDSEIDGGIEKGLRVDRVADAAAQWWDSEGNIVFAIHPMSGTDIISFTVRNDLGL